MTDNNKICLQEVNLKVMRYQKYFRLQRRYIDEFWFVAGI